MSAPFSLRRRLTIAMLFVFLLGLLASAAFYYFEVARVAHDLRKRTLQNQAHTLIDGLALSGEGAATFDLPVAWRDAYRSPEGSFFFTLYDAAGRPVARSPNLETPLPLVEPATGDLTDSMRFIGFGADELAVLAAPAPERHVLVVGRSRLHEEALEMSLIEEDFEHLTTVIIPFVLGALVVVHLVTRWSLLPVLRASREAAAVGPGQPDLRIDPAGLPSEIQPLVTAINAALERLAEAYIAERRLTANAAHELRTPLAVLSLRLQKARLGGEIDWARIEDDVARLSRLVGQLLDLARKESPNRPGDNDETSDVNLARVAREAAALVLPLAEAAGRSIDVAAPDAVAVPGRGDDLHDMVRNLLENAVAHGRGQVRITVRSKAQGDGQSALATVLVEDDGDGVAAALQDEMFDRFRKGRASSSGAGLGLAIVRQVARSHGGDARFLRGPGCRIEVALPARGPSPTAGERRPSWRVDRDRPLEPASPVGRRGSLAAAEQR